MILADPDGLLLPPIPPELERAIREMLARQRGRVGCATIALHFGQGAALGVTTEQPSPIGSPRARLVDHLTLTLDAGCTLIST